jgi:drug/metabolite transporter (DMT)-like permease
MAMVMRAAKSIVQARLLSKDERIDPVTLLYYMSPFALALLIVMTLVSEGTLPFVLLWQGGLEWSGFAPTKGHANGEGNGAGWPRLMMVLLLSGLNACFLNISGFFVTRSTSAVTMQVLGVFKTCIGVVVSVAVLRNTVRTSQAIGTAICVLGVLIYDRKSTSRKVTPEQAKGH